MQINKRIFSYPILSDSVYNNAYLNKYFKLSFEQEELDNKLILKDLCFKCDSKVLIDMFNNGKLKVKCVVECPSSIYKDVFEIGLQPRNISIYLKNLTQKLYISAFAYSTEYDILKSSKEFDEDYRDIDYKISKYQLLAFDTNYNMTVFHNDKDDDLVKSIFSIVPLDDENENDYAFELLQNKIKILLNRKLYDIYQTIYKMDSLKETFFSLLLIPALQGALYECLNIVKEDNDFEVVREKYNWFSSIMYRYEMLNGKKLTEDIFKECDLIKLAQEIMNKPIRKSFETLNTLRKMKGDETNEEDD